MWINPHFGDFLADIKWVVISCFYWLCDREQGGVAKSCHWAALPLVGHVYTAHTLWGEHKIQTSIRIPTRLLFGPGHCKRFRIRKKKLPIFTKGEGSHSWFSQLNAQKTLLACPLAKKSTASLKNRTHVSAPSARFSYYRGAGGETSWSWVSVA